MGLIEALDRLEELLDLEDEPGVTVDNEAFADAQEAVKQAVCDIVCHADDMVDRTDVLEDDDGEPLKTLPNPGLERAGENTALPDAAGGSS
jgi:hypothetical protein